MEDSRTTLTARVQRLEDLLSPLIGSEEFSGCDKAVTGEERLDIRRGYNYDKVEGHREQATLAPKNTALEEIINRIQSSTHRIMEWAAVLEAIGDRIMGVLPEEKTECASGANRGPDGTPDHTHLALNALDYACSRLDAAALRLERI